MKQQRQSLARVFTGMLPAFFWMTAALAEPLDREATADKTAALSHSSTGQMTGETLLSKMLEHNRLREATLEEYSATRTYVVKKDNGKVRAETEVLLQYRAPGTKEFKILSEKGSGFVRGRVFKPLLESEVEAAAGRNRRDSSITPANYDLEVLGEEEVDSHLCYVAQAIPKRKDKYLFEGKIWIDATDFAVARIEGRPARNPSFWVQKVDFVRRYQKIGEFWFPRKDETVSQVRIAGKNILIIDHDNYEIVGMEQAGKDSVIDLEGRSITSLASKGEVR